MIKSLTPSEAFCLCGACAGHFEFSFCQGVVLLDSTQAVKVGDPSYYDCASDDDDDHDDDYSCCYSYSYDYDFSHC